MAALENLREHWLVVGTELLVRATRSICDGSLLNAETGRADTRARIEEWTSVLTLYAPVNESDSVRVSA
jgi:head-tail adaptor